jgi:hypothetical protein
MRQTKAQRQAQWLTEFTDQVVSRVPAHSGRIEWPAALHYYFTGLTPAEGAARYLAYKPNGPEVTQ